MNKTSSATPLNKNVQPKNIVTAIDHLRGLVVKETIEDKARLNMERKLYLLLPLTLSSLENKTVPVLNPKNGT